MSLFILCIYKQAYKLFIYVPIMGLSVQHHSVNLDLIVSKCTLVTKNMLVYQKVHFQKLLEILLWF